MRAGVTGLAIALAVTASAAAEDFVDNGLWIEVKNDLLKANWPHGADGSLIYGKVLLNCGIGPDRFAKNCTVKASQPQNPAMERAALELAPLYRTWKTWGLRPSRATLLVDLQYDEPPEPLRKPTYAEMMKAYPAKAGPRRNGAIDLGTIKCIIQADGTARTCSVVSEERAGLGFGEAAVKVAQTMKYKPAMKNGQAVESEITLPLVFQVLD